jgi:prohibitin 2
MTEWTTAKIAKWVGIGFAALFVLVTITQCFVAVDSGHVGIVRTMGAINKDELTEGFHLKLPYVQSVVQVSSRLKPFPANAEAASKDLQRVNTQVTVPYSIVGANAAELYQKIGGRAEVDAAIISPAIQESLKAVTARYTAEQLVTQREAVKLGVHEAIHAFVDAALKERSLEGALSLNSVAITDFDFSDVFKVSIEAKVTAEQKALEAIRKKQQRITEAEASAAEKTHAADAAAYKIERESKARAAAIMREGEALSRNPHLTGLRAAEKWTGDLPEYMTGEGQLPFLGKR